jgi:hypothetical protein
MRSKDGRIRGMPSGYRDDEMARTIVWTVVQNTGRDEFRQYQ